MHMEDAKARKITILYSCTGIQSPSEVALSVSVCCMNSDMIKHGSPISDVSIKSPSLSLLT